MTVGTLTQYPAGVGWVTCNQNRLFGCGERTAYEKKSHRLPVPSGRVRITGFTKCRKCGLPLSVIRNARFGEIAMHEQQEALAGDAYEILHEDCGRFHRVTRVPLVCETTGETFQIGEE